MSRVLAAHQPNFMPYLGFFDKMKKADVFVIRDEVQFVKRDFHHRNRIRINSNDNINNPMHKWLSVPVEKSKDYILNIPIKKETRINGLEWNKQMLRDIKLNYYKTPFFDDYFSDLKSILNNSDDKLVNLNIRIINFLKKVFGINSKVVMASDLKLSNFDSEKSDASLKLAELCKELNADVYLSGSGGRNYLNLDVFKKQGIKVEFQDFVHPEYKQKFPGFVSNLAAIDALFCVGENGI